MPRKKKLEESAAPDEVVTITGDGGEEHQVNVYDITDEINEAMAEKFPEGIPEAPEETEPVDPYDRMALELLKTFRYHAGRGEPMAQVLAHPDHLEPLMAAFMALPEELVSAEMKEQVRIDPDAEVETFRVITLTELEYAWLQGYLGPREHGGNGQLPKLAQYLEGNRVPLRFDLTCLRVLAMLDILKRIDPGIIVPTGGPNGPPIGAQLLTGRR